MSDLSINGGNFLQHLSAMADNMPKTSDISVSLQNSPQEKETPNNSYTQFQNEHINSVMNPLNSHEDSHDFRQTLDEIAKDEHNTTSSDFKDTEYFAG